VAESEVFEGGGAEDNSSASS